MANETEGMVFYSEDTVTFPDEEAARLKRMGLTDDHRGKTFRLTFVVEGGWTEEGRFDGWRNPELGTWFAYFYVAAKAMTVEIHIEDLAHGYIKAELSEG